MAAERLSGRTRAASLLEEERKTLLRQLTSAEGLELYLATKYPAQKRFSLEGGDSLIPMLDDLIQQGGQRGVEEIVIGMAHRGRLNVLVNVVGKSPQVLFSEFEGRYDANHMQGSGDVKYHKGFSTDIRTPGGNVHVALAFNPSHLEVVNPVVEGSVRARQQRRNDATGDQVAPILIHGDAAFAGQGVVMETLQLSQARGFYTGGTIHIIINNQVGFTISDPRDSRSTLYCSDVAKMIEAPIFHVNGDDPEAVLFVTRLALDYRMTFHKDVVIDLVCYRRRGHNEADEPAATQPMMYQTIRRQATTRQKYAEKLAAEGVITLTDADAMVEQYRRTLDEGRSTVRHALGMIGNKHTVDWSKYHDADFSEPTRDRRAHRAAAGVVDEADELSVELHAASASREHRAGPREDGGGAAPARLGLRRDARVRDAADRRIRSAHRRSGQRPRHVLPSARRVARSEPRRNLRRRSRI